MPYAYRIQPDENLVCHRLFGQISTQDIRDMLAASRQDPDYRPGMDVFDDLSGVTSSDFGYNQMGALCSDVAAAYCDVPTRCLIYAPGDFAFGMSRMYATMMEDADCLDIRIVRSLEDVAEFPDHVTPPAAFHLNTQASARPRQATLRT